MDPNIPEKVKLLQILKDSGFNVPDFIYITADDFKNENFGKVEAFFAKSCKGFKAIARSVHPLESSYKGGTFDSLEINTDIIGLKYSRKRIIKLARYAKKLHILRQQKFNNAPELDLDQMGILVMPFIEGANVMAKIIGRNWEFGYTNKYAHRIQCESYITETPHDKKLISLSKQIQETLGFRCEIEFLVSKFGEIHLVQAKDISTVEIFDIKRDKSTIRLDGLRRIRKNRNYRERVIYVMDNRAFYLNVICKCEDFVIDGKGEGIDNILGTIKEYEDELEEFALKHERFGILGLNVNLPNELFQIANHYLDDTPEFQKRLSEALYENQYKIDYFMGEADTIIAKDRIRLNLCTHDAYGIDTVRHPLWFVYWMSQQQDAIVKQFREIGFKTGDTICIDVDNEEKPTVYRM